jgi:hypothetical protein
MSTANAILNTTQTANVVPNTTWTHDELQDFATKYGPYCYDIVKCGIVPASLFAGIELPVPDLPDIVFVIHKLGWMM